MRSLLFHVQRAAPPPGPSPSQRPPHMETRCASWSIYPRVHGDPDAIARPAGKADQNGDRIKVEMGHRINYKSVQNECMELADGAAKLRDLALEAEQRRVSKHNLTKTSWSYGRNGPGAKYVITGRMPEVPPGDHRATCCRAAERPWSVSRIPSRRRLASNATRRRASLATNYQCPTALPPCRRAAFGRRRRRAARRRRDLRTPFWDENFCCPDPGR